jgi:iron transport multicopper oxidase
LTAVIGMATVAWYTLGGHISEQEMEDEARKRIATKDSKGRFFGLLPKRS